MLHEEEYIKRSDIRFARLVQIALSWTGRVEYDELVKFVSELTKEYYHIFFPYNEQTTRNMVSDALRRLKTGGKVRKVKRGVWELTRNGWIELANYHIRVKPIPEELISPTLSVIIEEMQESID